MSRSRTPASRRRARRPQGRKLASPMVLVLAVGLTAVVSLALGYGLALLLPPPRADQAPEPTPLAAPRTTAHNPPAPPPARPAPRPHPAIRWPRSLGPGSTVAVVATGSRVREDYLAAGVQVLEGLGLKVKLGAHVLSSSGGRAGTVAERCADFERAWRDQAVDAIWCARGGHGSAEMLDRLDWSVVGTRDVALVGYSDVTVLQLALFRRHRLVSISGPMVASDHGLGIPGGAPLDTRRLVLQWLLRPGALPAAVRPPRGDTPTTVRPGRAEGFLLGGNLSRLCDLVGTDFLPDFSDAILVIEDVNETPESITAMLDRLRRAGVFGRVNGVLLGDFSTCISRAELSRVVLACLDGRDVPVLSGFPYGHLDEPRATLPIGAWVRLDAYAGTLTAYE